MVSLDLFSETRLNPEWRILVYLVPEVATTFVLQTKRPSRFSEGPASQAGPFSFWLRLGGNPT